MRGIGNVRAWAVGVCLVGAFGLGSGCSGEKSNENPPVQKLIPPGSASPQDVLAKLPGGDEYAAGKKVYANNECARCHKLGDTGGGGMMAGGLVSPPPDGQDRPTGKPPGPAPNLTKVGAAPEHTRQWLAAHIRDAKQHTPKSRMPAFPPEQISEGDLESLIEYLASLK